MPPGSPAAASERRKPLPARRTFNAFKVNATHLGGWNLLPALRTDRAKGRLHFFEVGLR
jgi:hypothetical protein